MEKENFLEKIALLEFQNDQLSTELEYIDTLLRSVGFSDGLTSLKSAAQELAEFEKMEGSRFEDGLPDDPPGVD